MGLCDFSVYVGETFTDLNSVALYHSATSLFTPKYGLSCSTEPLYFLGLIKLSRYSIIAQKCQTKCYGRGCSSQASSHTHGVQMTQQGARRAAALCGQISGGGLTGQGLGRGKLNQGIGSCGLTLLVRIRAQEGLRVPGCGEHSWHCLHATHRGGSKQSLQVRGA